MTTEALLADPKLPPEFEVLVLLVCLVLALRLALSVLGG